MPTYHMGPGSSEPRPQPAPASMSAPASSATKKASTGRVVLVIFIACLVLCICCMGATALMVTGDSLWEKVDNASQGHFTPSEITEVGDGEAVRPPQVQLQGNGQDTVTIMVYMNGSTLETEGGEATIDLTEMARAGSSDKVNIVVQTMGTRRWQRTYGISNTHSQIYTVNKNGLTLVKDDLGQLDCTAPNTLRDFISWSASNYPADHYILIMWDHGAGPVYGFGYDEYQGQTATLTLDEMQAALGSAGVYFDFIGMDCCIMSCMEVCCALYDFCDYMVLSEDFESGLGWYYTNWLAALYNDTSISTPDLAKIIIDDMVNKNKTDRSGGDAILTCIDQSVMKVLYVAWKDFAYANEQVLLNKNYSQQVHRTGRARPGAGIEAADAAGAGDAVGAGGERYNWFSDWIYQDSVTMDDYYITDIMAVAKSIDSEESKALASAVNQAIVYSNSTQSNAHLTGLSVTLPYGDRTFYNSLKTVFTNCGFDQEYIEWLGKFVGASGSDTFYDWSDWSDLWSGWDSYTDTYDWYGWDYYGSSDWGSGNYNGSDWGWDTWDYGDSWNQYYDSYGSNGYGSGYGGYNYDYGYDSGWSGYDGGYGGTGYDLLDLLLGY
ncbi:MAG: hypothetical protein IJJ14_02170 [Coriobacteriales bacterium]|nr:hypothetical protein [Coriobacteriales bacterium]